MNKIRAIALTTLSIALGIVFLYSAWTKLNPIQVFEYTLVEFARFSWIMAAMGARLLIGFEAALGTLLVFNLYGRGRWVLKSCLWLLVAFSLYLIYLWITRGNDVNCGCFGDDIWMSPSASLIKNAIMIAATAILLRFHKGLQFKKQTVISIATVFLGTALPFILFGLPAQQPNWLRTDKYQADLSALYTSDKADAPQLELRKGKHVIAFFSLTCPHCRMAAYKMHLMKEKNPSLPFYMVLNGDKENLPAFMEETKAENIPYSMLLGRNFTDLAGYSLPTIYYVNDSWIEAKTDYISMDQAEIEKWLAN